MTADMALPPYNITSYYMSVFLTRFAPSPTGFLHLGHAASALAVWKAAECAGGPAPILRIEDTDVGRCRPEFETQILEDLAWLGFEWQAGVRRQSEHFSEYEQSLIRLTARGLTYKCFRTRKEISQAGGEAFQGTPLPADQEEEYLAEGRPFSVRLSLKRSRDLLGNAYDQLSYLEQNQGHVDVIPADPESTGDVILKRKDTPAAYHLACTHDDAAASITHIVRGEDLLAAAPVHTLIQALMDWPRPIYIHHRLILGPDGKKLAKRSKSASLASLREKGMRPDEVLALALAE